MRQPLRLSLILFVLLGAWLAGRAPAEIAEENVVLTPAVFVLDDADLNFAGDGPFGDAFLALGAGGEQLFRFEGYNNTQSIGAVHGVVVDPRLRRVYFREQAGRNRLVAMNMAGELVFERENANAFSLALDQKPAICGSLPVTRLGRGISM